MEDVLVEMFGFHNTVDAQALGAKLVEIAGNSLGSASELRIDSELRALSTAIERLPAPFAGVSRNNSVGSEPVRVTLQREI